MRTDPEKSFSLLLKFFSTVAPCVRFILCFSTVNGMSRPIFDDRGHNTLSPFTKLSPNNETIFDFNVALVNTHILSFQRRIINASTYNT